MAEMYPSEKEQVQALSLIHHKYPLPRKYPIPSQSYPHWHVDDWYYTKDSMYFKLEYGKHRSDNMIQADYFSWEWHAEKTVYLKIDRATKAISNTTEEDFNKSRVLEDINGHY